ncbi:unnamed protein product [Paramecium octaurelia]|uniref:poly(ADP-ribose) glycohydrolase n=1 Tax=Paramecium octaurelia TaxID=43137 RepID=A0A8S1VPR6_PAROT|nr:unnamed protein product [Paramecium octaurelia]
MIQKDVKEKRMYKFPTLSKQQAFLLTKLLSPQDRQSALPIISELTCNNGAQIKGLDTAIFALDKSYRDMFFQNVLPKMAKYALEMLELPPKKELLISEGSISFTRKEIYQFLSLSFFGLLVTQDEKFPDTYNLGYILQTNIEKAKCYLYYFIMASPDLENEIITVERITFNADYHIKQFFPNPQANILEDAQLWSNCEKNLQTIEFVDQKIEEQQNCILVDFANKYVGGGVLRNGCVQEEILFTIMPENIIAVLFCKVLDFHQIVIIKNTIRYCDYEGYANSFRFVKRQPTNLNQNILVLDAINYKNNPDKQFQQNEIMRELNKAFIGFSLSQSAKEEEFLYPISTGKWGCGVFKGNTQLKTIIQLLAFSASTKSENQKRRMIFSTFKDKQLQFIKRDVDHIIGKYKTVGKLFSQLMKITPKYGVFEFLLGQK